MLATTLFAGLDESDVQRIAAAAHHKRIDLGEFYFLQGDPADRIFLLEQGRLKLTQAAADGQQALLRVAAPGTLFGALALAKVEVYPVSAQAAEDCQAAYWTPDELMVFVQRLPELAINAMKIMADHVQEFQDRYLQLATERVERRLARTLIRLASQTGRKTSEGVLIDLALTRQDLAEMSGTTLVHRQPHPQPVGNAGPGGGGSRKGCDRFPARPGANCRGFTGEERIASELRRPIVK